MERALKATKSVDKNAAMEKAKAAKVGIDSVRRVGISPEKVSQAYGEEEVECFMESRN